jgi:hypothetical protein
MRYFPNPVAFLKLRCPSCFEKLFRVALTQSFGKPTIWECLTCGYEDSEDHLIDHTPIGCIAVSHGTEISL